MKNLKNYIDRKNQWAAIFKDPQITFPLTQQNINEIVDSLNMDLSPENLSCDGEISATQIRARYRFYSAVARELAQYTGQHQLNMQEIYEL